jgi:Mg/Co/Ni transporter MgtE
MVGQVNFGGRVRDRATITEQTQEVVAPKLTPAQSERQRLIDFYSRSHEAEQQHERDECEAKERKRKEARELEAKRKWKAEEDARVLREAQERQQRVLSQNMIRREVKQILQDATAEEMTEVLKRVEASRTKGFPAAYAAYLDEVRAEKQVK